MTKDLNKLISSIEYNYLNLPTNVTFMNGHSIEYVYDATGFRRSVIYKTQQEPVFSMLEAENFATAQPLVIETVKHYSGNRIYNAQTYPTNIFTENGYIESGIYHFYIKDYQGNNRVVINQDGAQVQVNHYYPYGATMGEGLATSTQPYKYGGKELDTMNGLNQYDFGARQQDPALGIFTSIDPMAEKYPSISPYAYCAGNPILYTDPTGRDIAILITDMHIAMLIQDKNGKWKYYSVNGNNMYSSGSGSSSESSQGGSGFVGGDKKDNTGEKSYNSAQDFLDSKDNKESYNYSEAYVIKTSPEQDKTMDKNFKAESAQDYNVVTQNCATAVINTMESVGISSYDKQNKTYKVPANYSIGESAYETTVKASKPIIPSSAYNSIIQQNPKGKRVSQRK